MADTVDHLIVDLLNSLATRERSYEEMMEAWRTSCPKLPVWEDANDRGFVSIEPGDSSRMVRITEAGREFLAAMKKRPSDTKV